MPELPEITLFTKNLKRLLARKEVSDVSFGRVRGRKLTEAQLKKAIKGAKVADVRRAGKELHFEFDNGSLLSIHLMLHGRVDLTKEPDSIKWMALSVGFKDGQWLVLSDRTGWATIALNPELSEAPDALSEEFDLKYLTERLRRRPKMPIKTFIIDQQIIGGIGNVFSDEILWDARIAPESPAGKLPDEAIKTLHKSIKSVLKNAVKQTEKRAPDAINGKIRDFVKVHDAKKEESPTGHKIKKKQVGQKHTYYTDEQVLYR